MKNLITQTKILSSQLCDSFYETFDNKYEEIRTFSNLHGNIAIVSFYSTDYSFRANIKTIKELAKSILGDIKFQVFTNDVYNIIFTTDDKINQETLDILLNKAYPLKTREDIINKGKALDIEDYKLAEEYSSQYPDLKNPDYREEWVKSRRHLRWSDGNNKMGFKGYILKEIEELGFTNSEARKNRNTILTKLKTAKLL